MRQEEQNIKSLKPLVHEKVITKNMAHKIGKSELCYDHLKISIARNGLMGLESILKEQTNGKPHVTNKKTTHTVIGTSIISSQ